MGQFDAGLWIIGLSIYFFVFFVVVTQIILASSFYDVDSTGVYASDTGFGSAEATPSNYSGTYSSTTSTDVSDIRASIAFMTGFGADNIGIGLHSYQWIFSFIFFYIPASMLLWSIWMALPFLH